MPGEGGDDRGTDVVGQIGRDERDDRPTEPSAGHPSAEGAGRQCRVHSSVEFGTGDVVVVAQGGVRGGEQRADVGDPTGPQQLDGAFHPVVLGDDVPEPAAQLVVGELAQRGGQVVDGDLPKLGDAQDLGGQLAGGAPLAVLAVGEGVSDSGVDDQHREVVRVGIERDVLGAA